MPGRKSPPRVRDAQEPELVARAAWLHFVGGLTQSEVARRLQVPTTRAHRYIARAQSEGLVRIFVDVSSASCVAIETTLIDLYDLDFCRVAIDTPEPGPLPLRSLSAVGADYLMQMIASGGHDVVGIGHGRTIAASVGAMGRVDGGAMRFVSMLGGLTRSYAANPYDVIHRLAEKTGAASYLMPAPLFANSAEDKRVLLAQRGVAATQEMIRKASLAFVGIGDLDPAGGAAAALSLDQHEISRLSADGARAEILGQFINGDGQIMETEFDDRVMAAPLKDLKGRKMVAIMGGVHKKEAVEATLKSGLLTGLIIDEATARALVGKSDPEAVAVA